MKCPGCQAENRDGARFCRECGARLEITCTACGESVSRADLLRGLIARPAGAPGAASGDRKLHEALMSRIRAESWTNLLFLNVLVRDGEVELWGVAGSEEQREALRVLAESMPGVGAVRTSVRVMPRHVVDS